VSQPAATPPAGKTIDTLLDEARAGMRRLTPDEARAATAAGAALIDIRSEAQRARDGVVPAALFFPRNVLEWRCDPTSPSHDARVGGLDRHLVVMCDEGFQSSLAAACLRQLGFTRATDVIGGFQAWRGAGLPVLPQIEGDAMRGIECPCGHHFEAADDDELFRLCREHVDREHPEMQRTDAQIRERVAGDAYDMQPVA
jgi:rhodanese-related sulfurtransferase/predicted small metal-binding protein